MSELLLAKEVNAALNEKIKKDAEELRSKGISPKLAIVRLGEREDDISYERGAVKRCESLGVEYEKVLLPADASQEEVLDVIERLNKDDSVHGVLLFRPLPKQLDESLIVNTLAPEKDVDGITDISLAGVFAGKALGFAPCTADACLRILDHYGIDPAGKRCTVIGRSLVIGRPVAMLLMQRNATVTICHTKTKDLPSVVREAELVVVAAGKAGIAGSECLGEGQTVLDVGIHVNEEGKLCGDVRFDEVKDSVAAITPVPGGVGGVTTSVLLEHVVEAAKKRLG